MRVRKVRYQLGAAPLVATNRLREHNTGMQGTAPYSRRGSGIHIIEYRTRHPTVQTSKQTNMPQSPLHEPLTTPKLYHACAIDDTAAEPRK
jgi:hypothetical protein